MQAHFAGDGRPPGPSATTAAAPVATSSGTAAARYEPVRLPPPESRILLFDLLTANRELDRANVFDIDLLGHRLLEVTAWLQAVPAPHRLLRRKHRRRRRTLGRSRPRLARRALTI